MIELYKSYENARNKIMENFDIDFHLGLDIDFEVRNWIVIYNDQVCYLVERNDEIVAMSLDNINSYKSKCGKYKLFYGDDGCGGQYAVILDNSMEITDEEKHEEFQERYC